MLDTDNLVANIKRNTFVTTTSAGATDHKLSGNMSGAPTTQPGINDVLKRLGFIELSEGTTLYTPTQTSRTPSTDPTLLILCSWAFAQPRHIAKYITPYQTMYPTTSILLLQNVIGNLIWTPDAWQHSFFQPAAAAIQSHITSTESPHILLHLFSNGGAHAAVQLSETYHQTCGGSYLPIDALILDSAPGIPRFTATVHAMAQGVPKGSPILKGMVAVFSWAMVGTTAVCKVLGIAEPAARKLYRRLYDPYDVFLFQGPPKADKERKPVPRSYIYSKQDTMILEEDVVAHAHLACQEMQEAGLSEDEIKNLIRQEEFVGTAHVNHVKGDSDRYWSIVKETWERSQRV